MKINKTIYLFLFISLASCMLFSAEINKITKPSDFAKFNPKLKVPLDKVTCTNTTCAFNFQNHKFEDRSDFSWLDLKNANFSGASLINANFTGSDLTGAHFSGAKLEGATFKGAIVTNANFSGADLTNAETVPGMPSAASSNSLLPPMLVTALPQAPATPMPAPKEPQVSTVPRTTPALQPMVPTPPPTAAQKPPVVGQTLPGLIPGQNR